MIFKETLWSFLLKDRKKKESQKEQIWKLHEKFKIIQNQINVHVNNLNAEKKENIRGTEKNDNSQPYQFNLTIKSPQCKFHI